jgi:ribonuclease HII
LKYTYFQNPVDRGYLEAKAWREGFLTLGVDEVGKGCLAGPVYAAACCLDWEAVEAAPIAILDRIVDSKKLSELQRQSAAEMIADLALASAVAYATVQEIEELGIQKACFLAMLRAIERVLVDLELCSSKNLNPKVLIDGTQILPELDLPQMAVVKGDLSCLQIAAASILAKLERDRYMKQQSDSFPWYGFERNVGYGTAEHMVALMSKGPCTLHRRNYAPVRRAMSSESTNN